jgi:hypothetical protein
MQFLTREIAHRMMESDLLQVREKSTQRKPQKPGSANPKGERPARSEQTCAASGR